ncbi:MAG: hypothetical protein ACK41E_01375 [Deinococcales bacterium]
MTLADYTLRRSYNPDWNVWEAELLEFFALKASGASPEEATAELERLFLERRAYYAATGKPMPVPGEPCEEMFSSTARIDAQAALARDFFDKVLHLDYDEVFLHDATTLEEFGELDSIRNRVFTVYGVDISLEAERPVWAVLELIRESSK